MKAPRALPGWQTGYFRLVGVSGDPLMQRFVNIFTQEIKDMPYDSQEEDWFPLYVYMGKRPL